ncbi:MAG: hypothetical protein GC160_11755 [Acidobacteria bacterium]|nr:hypothetical protein [Acidobacteriota bacterium]
MLTVHRSPSFAVLAAALALSACTIVNAASVTEEVDRTVPLSADGSVSVSNVNGKIDVSTWERNEVRIRAIKSAESKAKLDETEVRIETGADSVTVKTELPRHGSASVNYEISAPAGADVRVDTVNGHIRMTGAYGDVRAHSVNGGVNAAGLSGDTKIDTVNGGVEAVYAQAPSAGSHQFHSVNGSLEVLLPSSPDASFRAHTVNGGIRTDFALEVRKARFGPTSSMDGTLGSGAAKFELDTVNGAIRILNGTAAASVR